MSAPTKLIDVALPLQAINQEAALRKRKAPAGYPTTLHKWWAQRPVAACRAILFAQLVDDPSAHLDEFPTEEDQQRERDRLFALIERIVPWAASTDEAALLAARREIARSVAGPHGVKVASDADAATVDAVLRQYAPPVLDPFCGGGSIPLEAQRLGLEAHASDLNPVAVLITKALIEIPPRFADRPPVHPVAEQRELLSRPWQGAQGLAEDVRYYGRWMRDEAEQRIGHLYPKVKLPPEHGGGEAPVIAWLWARTVTCPNPACRAHMPLLRSFALSTKKGKEAWVEPIVERPPAPPASDPPLSEAEGLPTPPLPLGEGRGEGLRPTIRFETRAGAGTVPASPKTGRGAKFRCLACGQTAPDQHIKDEGMAGRMDAQLMAIVADSPRGRIYLPPTPEHEAMAAQAEPSWRPEQALGNDPRAIWCVLYGLTTFDKLFTPRQLVALTTFSDLVADARTRALADALAAGLPDDSIPFAVGGAGATAYADAIATYLAFALSRLADYGSSLATWRPKDNAMRSSIPRQGLPMAWDFAEGSPFGTSSAGFLECVNVVARVLSLSMNRVPALVHQANAIAVSGQYAGTALISTDPPYYDNIGYADLADFFYVWLRPILSRVYPALTETIQVPKGPELVASPYRFDGDKEKARDFFEDGLEQAFERIRDVQQPGYPLTIYYAYKQSEADDGDDEDIASEVTVSTGWETMLGALLKAGLSIQGTWPLHTEGDNRQNGVGANALASSIVLVCRPRPTNAPIATRRDFLRALRTELPSALQKLTTGDVPPVDLAQAAIGPGMAVFSRYAHVLEPDGSPMRVRTALALINDAVQTYFASQEGDLDPVSQFCLAWYKQHGTDSGPFGDADILSRAKNVVVDTLAHEGLVKSHGGRVQLLRAADPAYQGDWEPRGARPISVWEATHRLVAAHASGGDRAAAKLAYRLGGLADQARDLAYRLFQIADAQEGPAATQQALGYNNLVAAWPAIQRLAADTQADYQLPGQTRLDL